MSGAPGAAARPTPVLLFGATGQVGREILRRAGAGRPVEALDRRDADLADPAACAARVAASTAPVVINAAAYTAVDRAETEEALARRVNADAPGAMAAAAAARGAAFLHVSTDYVFDGAGDRPWREDDAPNPLSAYGRTKLAGERAVAAAGGAHAIVRTSWVHAGHGANFVRTMLRAGRARPRLTVVDDQLGGPTPAGAVADALLAIGDALARGGGAPGLYHFAGAPPVSWRVFAEAIFRHSAGPAPEIAPILTADWPAAAPRPLYGVLDCARIAAAFGIAQPDWRDTLGGVVAELEEAGP
jgi:dTDP-4-dehydrorhamnose reductase